MAATLPSAASRACTSGIRSGSGIPRRRAAVSRIARADPVPHLAQDRDQLSAFHVSGSSVAVTIVPSPPRGAKSPTTVARHRLGRLHHVAQHAVHHVLLKNAEIAVRQQVHLVRLQLQARLSGT